ncbi:hypothetical protein SCHPADRAFT_929415 [Schizopora paradoxa]|uniref:F-box domain-containing protein n=1 Tax=Schizopora paradoxa TaxID=27342 RepID=A0A0H2RKL0_9AGAM|nr:hypothetical protein SCHPADRAFT_929415 [Schizopora paradoxa]
MLFHELPTEILANLLQMLAYTDILSCRETCKLLRGIIDKSVAVQYALELGASGKLDNLLCAKSNADKLAELREVNRRWAQFRWKHRVGPIPVRSFASVYEFTGGCFFQDLNESYASFRTSSTSSISWLPFPRPNSIGVHEWGHNYFGFRPADICVDVNRDLLVVIERKDSYDGRNQSVICTAHFRTISTNEPHPDALVPTICVCTETNPLICDHSMVVQLGGDHLGLLLSRREIDYSRNDKLHVWNWTNNIRKANITTESNCRWDSFCFLADDAILLPDTGLEELSIYLLTPEPNSIRHTISLQLPETKMKHAIHYMSVRCEPIARSPTSNYHIPTSRISTQTSCQTDPHAAIVIVAMDYAVPTEGEALEIDDFVITLPDPQVFAIKRKKLLELAKGSKEQQSCAEASSSQEIASSIEVPRLHSREWIRFTRWGLSPVPARWICFVQGSRYISMPHRPSGSKKKMALKFYDFNIMEERKAECMSQDFLPEVTAGAQAEGWIEDDDEDEEVEFIPNEVGKATKISTPTKWPVKSVIILAEPLKINKPELFKESFVTSLSCRLIETEAVFDWDSVVIDEDHVIGLKEGHPENDILESLDVLVF